MCRAGRISRSRSTDPSPNAESASRDPGHECGSQVVRTSDAPSCPRPPPPAAAFTRRGNPIDLDVARIVDLVRASRWAPTRAFPGTEGTPTRAASRRAFSLSPSASIVADDGAHEDDPSLLRGTRECRPFREEPVARVDYLGTRRACRLDDRVDPQVGLSDGAAARDERRDRRGGRGRPRISAVGCATATASIPSSWHARMMRTAISPRLAISTRRKGAHWDVIGSSPESAVFAQDARLASSGMLPCFFRGFVSRLFSSTSSARMRRGRVSRGRMFFIDVAPCGRDVRVGELGLVLGDQAPCSADAFLGPGDLILEDDVDRSPPRP